MERQRAHQEFARVYDEHVWRVYGFFAYRLRDQYTAEDLTQTTFERALRAWSRFDPRRASERTWLLAIAQNLMVDHLRRSSSRRGHAEVVPEPAAVPGPEERFGGSVELIGALSQLDDREREILALRFGGELTAVEIGELLGLSAANVHQIVSRSLRQLRQLLEEDGPARPGADVSERLRR